MIIENKLTSYLFKDLPATSPTTWDLSGYIPEGIGLLEHLQYRYRVPNQYTSPWYPVSAFNRSTQVATAAVPNGAMFAEFRRKTPRYDLIRDPLAKTSRVAQPDLQLNADQGMFVALEWAAEYGVDGHAQLVSGLPPLSLGDTMFTQQHYGPEADYTRTVWNFRFAGGYMEPEHVRVQIKVAGAWQAVVIDYAEYDHEAPSGAPYKLQGPFQLYLNFGELATQIEGMVIYRRTPREFPVSTPSHRSQITAEGMTPTATQAFFVAVELGEEMNRLVPECECLSVFTSKPYRAVLPPDTLSIEGETTSGRVVPQPATTDGLGLGGSVTYGSLRLVLQKYDVGPQDALQVTGSVTSGTLVIVLRTYSNWQESIDLRGTVTAGTLVVVLRQYTNAAAESLDLRGTVTSGTLT